MTSDSSKNLAPRDSVCDLCAQGYSCGILASAMKILDTETSLEQDTYSRELFKNFREKLMQFGFDFPESVNECWLHDKRPIINELIREAATLIEEVEARRHS